MAFCQLQASHGAPGCLVGQANVANLAGCYLFCQNLQGFFQWCDVFLFFVLVAELAEEVIAALRPMQLAEVNPVRLQAFQAGIQRGNYECAVVLELAVTDIADAVAWAGNLAGQDPVGAVAMGFEVIADDLLGVAVGFGARGTGYISAVSIKLIPAARARSIWIKASA